MGTQKLTLKGHSKFQKISLLLIVSIVSLTSSGQNKKALADTLAKDPALFIKLASKQLKWEEPAKPQQLIGPIYFVGTLGLASYLITTSEGHILLYTGMPSSGPMIGKSIRTLGFKPEDIKVLLTGHAHSDHVGAHAYIKKISGAQVCMMDAEKELIESGGKTDFHYGKYPEFWFDPVKVDRVLNNKDSVKLGNITLIALHTPGHTKGGTTWVMNITVNNKSYKIVFPDGTSINPGYRVAVDPSYPGILENYKKTLDILGRLKPDIWFSSHTDFFNYESKLKRKKENSPNPFIDPVGYQQRIANERKKLNDEVKKEKAISD
jgi:metallo-beta-lactamase class B